MSNNVCNQLKTMAFTPHFTHKPGAVIDRAGLVGREDQNIFRSISSERYSNIFRPPTLLPWLSSAGP